MFKGFHFWQFLAGITMFVYAMTLIESSIKNLAGRSFKKYLQKQSKNKLKSVVAGTVVTAFLQSSSVVLIMVLSFVGAGLMNLRGALAVALGSNLGTTMDSWVIAIVGFKINFDIISYPLLGISLLGLLSVRKATKFYEATKFLIGFAFIFIGLEWLKNCFVNPTGNILTSFDNLHYIWFIPIGFFFTALIQSSSATIAILLTALYNNLIPFENAAAIVIGSELGTTLKFLISSFGGIPDKKRVAYGNFIINFITMILAAFMIKPLIWIIQDKISVDDKLISLVFFQSGINIISILIFFPLLGFLANLLERKFKEDLSDPLAKFISKNKIDTTFDALKIAEKETANLINHIIFLNKHLLGIQEYKKTSLLNNLKELRTGSPSFSETYKRKKILQGEILEYITEIPETEMSEMEFERAGKIININRHIIRSAKNLKDIHHNLLEFAQTVNDYLFLHYEKIKESEREFYNEFQNMVTLPDEKIILDLANNLNNKNRIQYDLFIEKTITKLKEKKINELDSSNLLNVHHEIYSSNKALIKALADIIEIDTKY